jgi:NADH:ubiquinone oxidoreductase subunit 2 (subunit N)
VHDTLLHQKEMAMKWLLAFVAGFVSTLVFHQGLLELLHLAGAVPVAAWNMRPVPPLGVPSVISLAFWGGLWGVLLWALVRKQAGGKRWLWGAIWGALLPSIVALFVVFPLKGMPMAGGFNPKLIVGALLLNGVWGLGVVGLMKLYRQG